MKTAAVKSLVYKEFYMARKTLLIDVMTFLIFALIGILAEISFRSGNLALLSDAIKDDIKDTVDFSAVCFPVFMVCLFSNSFSEVSLKDDVAAWKRFCYSAPASHVDFALAKYMSFLITVLAEIMISFIYAAFVCRIIGTPLSALYIAYILACVALTTLMAVLDHVGILLFHTKDKAGLFMFGVLIGIILLPALVYTNLADAEITRETVNNSFLLFLPWLPVMTVVFLAAGCAASIILFKRREA